MPRHLLVPYEHFPILPCRLSNKIGYGVPLANGNQYTSKLVDYPIVDDDPLQLSQSERCNNVDGVPGGFIKYQHPNILTGAAIYFCHLATKSPIASPTPPPTWLPTRTPTIAPSRYPTRIPEPDYRQLQYVYENCTMTDFFPIGDYPNCEVSN